MSITTISLHNRQRIYSDIISLCLTHKDAAKFQTLRAINEIVSGNRDWQAWTDTICDEGSATDGPIQCQQPLQFSVNYFWCMGDSGIEWELVRLFIIIPLCTDWIKKTNWKTTSKKTKVDERIKKGNQTKALQHYKMPVLYCLVCKHIKVNLLPCDRDVTSFISHNVYLHFMQP